MEASRAGGAPFDAWNHRDPDAIAAALAPDGTYSDPNVPEGLRPAAAGEYARQEVERVRAYREAHPEPRARGGRPRRQERPDG